MAVGRGDRLNIPAAHRDIIRDGAMSSALVLADLIAGPLRDAVREEPGRQLDTVLDVGCGEGWLTAALREHGLEALGVDGDPLDGVDQVVDLEGELPDLGRFDLVTCLEVAEHVAPARADKFVTWLTERADVVLFSAAVPGQGGDGHVNEQPTDYWATMFERHHFHGSGELRWRLWDDERVEWWYRQNLLLFWNGVEFNPLAQLDGCPTVIHPGMWQHFHGAWA